MTRNSYFRVIFPKPSNVSDINWEMLANQQEKILVQQFKKYFIVEKDGDRVPTHDEFEEHKYETTFKIITRKKGNIDSSQYTTIDSWIILDIGRYLVTQGSLPTPHRSTVVFHSMDLFDPKICTEFKKQTANSLSFGHILENEFYADQIIHKDDINNNKGKRIFLNFEFDKPWFFQSSFQLKQLMSSGCCKLVEYQLKLDRRWINRIICDPNYADDENLTQNTVGQKLGIKRTRLFFELNAPVQVSKKIIGNGGGKFERVTSINSPVILSNCQVFCIEFEEELNKDTLYQLLSRLRIKIDVPIEFCRIKDPDYVTTNEDDYINLQYVDAREILQGIVPVERKLWSLLRNELMIKGQTLFSYHYLLECLLSRGSVVKAQLWKNWSTFSAIIRKHYNDDKTIEGIAKTHHICEAALEDLINHIDSKKNVNNICEVFQMLCTERRQSQVNNQLSSKHQEEGYRRIRKIIITPSGKLLQLPETIMGNRVFNVLEGEGHEIIRVSFRDDDGQIMRYGALGELMNTSVMGAFNGFCIAGRHFTFLGCSNSQMRDNGAYFLSNSKSPTPDGSKQLVDKLRNDLGFFERMESVPKALARMGQCFTQARSVDLNETVMNYKVSFDIIGGKNKTKQGYIFSDGVGSISLKMAQLISRKLRIGKDSVPSAFQFRYLGAKGMLVVNLDLDLTKSADIVLRPSQIKFATSSKNSKKHKNIEIVKFSSPTVLALNRPFLNILDHVSELQSVECHKTICGRIEELMTIHLYSITNTLIDEKLFRRKLEELPRRIHFPTLTTNFGFMLSSEPFFRSMIKACLNLSMNRLLSRTQINIPSNLGRSMFGVIDETGILQYGQVFVQYTKDVRNKKPSNDSGKEIVLGKVMITKCPSVVSGDVRIFKAVDIPQLHHLTDVVVFPAGGPRSHPDEMAGSDLDGDEYSVIWDEQLFFEKNEKAFDYCDHSKTSKSGKLDVTRLDQQMKEFYVKFMKHDNVGQLSINHLYNCDQFGINSSVSIDIAKKISEAVDFSKSGKPADDLRRKWESDKPPEMSERLPDFTPNIYKGTFIPLYTSRRLLGRIYRSLKEIDNGFKISNEVETDIQIDPMIDCENWEKFKERAEKQLRLYNGQLKSLMDRYGIRSEGELFSGCFLKLRNRISDKEQDDMSLYNTETIIETKVTELFRQYRADFFNQFSINPHNPEGYLEVTQINEDAAFYEDDHDVLNRICKLPTSSMERKAVAYYRVCYEEASKSQEKKLSFAWLAYDVLSSIRKTNLAYNNDRRVEPLYTNPVHRHIQKCRENFDDSGVKIQHYNPKWGPENRFRSYKLLEYINKYEGLIKLAEIFVNWAQGIKNKKKSIFEQYHIISMLIMFAKREIGRNFTPIGMDDIYCFEQRNGDKWYLSDETCNRLTLAFFQFLASDDFAKMKYLDFSPMGIKIVLMRGEWLPIHKAALKTYYNLVFNLQFDEISNSTTIIHEDEPFVMELPSYVPIKSIQNALKLITGCLQIYSKPVADYSKEKILSKYLITARGTTTSLNALHDTCAVKILKSHSVDQKLSLELAELRFTRICKLFQEVRND